MGGALPSPFQQPGTGGPSAPLSRVMKDTELEKHRIQTLVEPIRPPLALERLSPSSASRPRAQTRTHDPVHPLGASLDACLDNLIYIYIYNQSGGIYVAGAEETEVHDLAGMLACLDQVG